MVVVGGEEGGLVSYPYSCGWALYIIFYLYVLYSGSHTPNMLMGVRVTCHSATAGNHDTRLGYCYLYKVVTYSHLYLSLPVFVWQELCRLSL